MDLKEIEKIKTSLENEDTINDVANLFKVFSDSTRAKILSLLHNKELCVNDIALILDMTISAISHQLRILRDAKLVKNKKKGKEVIYCLDDDHVMKIIECGIDHVNEK